MQFTLTTEQFSIFSIPETSHETQTRVRARAGAVLVHTRGAARSGWCHRTRRWVRRSRGGVRLLIERVGRGEVERVVRGLPYFAVRLVPASGRSRAASVFPAPRRGKKWVGAAGDGTGQGECAQR
jgi:hypothetical protein